MPSLPGVIDVLRADKAAEGDFDASQQGVKLIRRFLLDVGRRADAAIADGPPASPDEVDPQVACLNRIFSEQDRLGVLIEKSRAMQSGYEQHWALAGLALAAFKLQRAGEPLSPQAVDWLRRIAGQVVNFHNEHGQLNNHALWAALGVGTTGYLTDDRQLIDWANAKVASALADMAEDGTLPREIGRKARASHYHFFAAKPLFTYAGIRACFGEPMIAEGPALLKLREALHRILRDPQWLAQKAGAEQDVRDIRKWRLWLSAMEQLSMPPDAPGQPSGRMGGRLAGLIVALKCSRS